MPRLALAIAYDGTRFESYARQPGRRTVEGELIALLQSAGAFRDAREARWRSGSRTDAGVSAAWNVVAFDSSIPAGAVVAATTRAPEGLHLLAATVVGDEFDPRHASRRTYRYFLPTPWNWKRVQPAARAFEGRHDFSNFRRADGDKAPDATIERIRYRARAPGPWVEITAPSFLWHQVRRIVAALAKLDQGLVSRAEILRALEDPATPKDFGIAPAERLLLVRVDYDEFTWPGAPRISRERLAAEIQDFRLRQVWLESVHAGIAGR